MNARPARGFQARDSLLSSMSTDHAHFQLYDSGTTLPLGWVLSSKAREDMKQQLNPGPEDSKGDMQKRTGEHLDNHQQWLAKAKKYNSIQTDKVLAHLNSQEIIR